ncbi:MAG TPA: small multi-drug export protein, partial [Sedimentisphaerales bacterium]|nr:small multi-drug export protein [Sedimentisphaerales bacterium]
MQRVNIEPMGEKTEQPGGTLNSQKRNQWKQTLLTSSEGRLLLVGVALAFIYTAWLGVKLLWSPEQSQVLIGMTAIDIMFGRAACMAFGYSLRLGHGTVISVCIIVETILVLVFYPLFVFSWQHLLVLKWLKRIMERTHEAAERHKEKIQKYGVIGLFFFVWFPFWMTGPVVGSVVGFLLGLPVRLNMTVVLVGTSAAIFGWAFFLRQLHEHVAS